MQAALRISEPVCLAIVGAGGKTSALFRLGRELAAAYGTALLTTTTHLGAWQAALADHHIIQEHRFNLEKLLQEPTGGVVLVTGQLQGERYTGPGWEMLSWLYEIHQSRSLPLLIEADGARQRPLKAPAEHEPVIPDFCEAVLVVAGMSGLERLPPLDNEHVHRPEYFARLSGLEIGAPITPEALSHVLKHPQGALKGIPPQARRYLLLNQADTPERQSIAGKIARLLQGTYLAIVIASLQNAQIFSVWEKVAGVVLAAGGGTRFGQVKQLLTWRGKPLVRHVSETALDAGLSPVVVVTGAAGEQVAAAVTDLPVQVVYNPAWASGQSSSLRVGLQALPPECGAAIFLLADQPQVPVTLLQALVEQHRQERAPVLAPLVRGRRATPVLFDRVTFPALMTLQGDTGGRAIFGQFPLAYLPWHDEGLLLDIDTPADWNKLQHG